MTTSVKTAQKWATSLFYIASQILIIFTYWAIYRIEPYRRFLPTTIALFSLLHLVFLYHALSSLHIFPTIIKRLDLFLYGGSLSGLTFLFLYHSCIAWNLPIWLNLWNELLNTMPSTGMLPYSSISDELYEETFGFERQAVALSGHEAMVWNAMSYAWLPLACGILVWFGVSVWRWHEGIFEFNDAMVKTDVQMVIIVEEVETPKGSEIAKTYAVRLGEIRG